MTKKNLPAVTKTLTVDEYTERLAIDMTDEVFKFVNFYEDKLGTGTGQILIASFLRDFIKQLVFNALNAHVEARDFQATMKAFAEIKTLVQDAVAQSFSEGVESFSGKPMDYYCDIKPVPKPVNKLPC